MNIKLPVWSSGSLTQISASGQLEQAKYIHYHGLWLHVNTNSAGGQHKFSPWDQINSQEGGGVENPLCKFCVVLRQEQNSHQEKKTEKRLENKKSRKTVES